jgi:general secretion pathway protein G
MRLVSISLRGSLSRPPGSRRRPGAAGFTIIEMLAVTAIIGALSTLAIPKVQDALEKARIARAIGDIRALQSDLDGQDSLPATLAEIGRGGITDPWGNPYQYYRFPPRRGGGPPRGARKDRFLVPINSTYDLYSMGKDGSTTAPLTARAGRDDIVRANDGGFIGLASKF